MIKQIMKKQMYAAFPRLSASFFAARSRANAHRAVVSWGCRSINDRLIERLGSKVLSGPFQGMTLTASTTAEQIGPYLLGTYESELRSCWDFVLKGDFRRIFDIGAKFGYYAVGLARAFPQAEVIAYDVDPWARRTTADMVAANGVKNVSIRGFCDPAELSTRIVDGSFIISDCEGYEEELFCSYTSSNFDQVTLLIETHDQISPGVSDRLLRRFEATHDVEVIESKNHDLSPEMDLSFLNDRERWYAIHEVRSEQSWQFHTPKKRSP